MLPIYYKSWCKMPNKFPKERLFLPIVSYKSKQIDKKVLSNSTRSLIWLIYWIQHTQSKTDNSVMMQYLQLELKQRRRYDRVLKLEKIASQYKIIIKNFFFLFRYFNTLEKSIDIFNILKMKHSYMNNCMLLII